MTTTTGGAEDGATEANLPARISAEERHRARLDADLHPVISVDDDVWTAREMETGVYIDDGDRLIGFLERNECPVCGKRGFVSLESRFTFVYGANTRERRDGEMVESEVLPMLERAGDRPLACRCGSTRYLVGIASKSAAEEYEEWRSSEDERTKFRRRVGELREARELEEAFNGVYDQGHLIAALYEELGCDSYDERELMGRTHVTKAHLSAILARVRSLETSERRSYTEDDWLVLQDHGVVNGRVEWHVPEWVDFDGLNYSHHYKTTVFGD